MRRIALPCLALALLAPLLPPVPDGGAATASGAGDLSGVWYAEYEAGGERVQEVSQRLEDGRWRAEIRVFEACRETRRTMLAGVWQAAGQVLTQTVWRRGHSLVIPPHPVTYDVLDRSDERLRLRGGEAEAVIEAQRVPRNFRPPPPEECAGRAGG